jgi:integrase
MGKLTAQFVQKAIDGVVNPGRYRDEHGLILNVSDGGASWMLRYHHLGRRRDIGLGKAKYVPLSKAREMRDKHMRTLKADRVDPLELREAEKRAQGNATPFAKFAEAWINDRILPLDRKRAVQWLGSLRTHAFPKIGNVSIADISRAQVLEVIEPIWMTKHETARRVRQRIERLLDVAQARGLRTDSNPARTKDLRAVLDGPRPKPKHHAALPWGEVPAFYRALCKQPGNGAMAFRFAILTVARTKEALGCLWSEVDENSKLWSLPATRMKMRSPHRVPLAKQALALIKAMPREDQYVFAGAKAGRPLSGMALLMTLRRMQRIDITAHGFRSSFRDWCAENGKPKELAEAALAHVRHGVEGAYFRSDLIERRRELMAEWARFVCGR